MAGNFGDPLFLDAAPGGFSATEFTRLGKFVSTAGVVGANDMSPSGTGVTMTFTAGNVAVTLVNGENYLCPLNATQTYTLPGGVASSGHERIDVLVAKVYNDPVETIAGGSNEWKIVAVTGTEAAVGSAVAPSLATTDSFEEICRVKVNSSGIQTVTDTRRRGSHPSLLDASGASRFVDKATSGEVITGSKWFSGGIRRGASGRNRGYNHLQATRTATYTLPNIAIATDAFTNVNFNAVNINVADDGLVYNALTGKITLDGAYSLSGMLSIKCPGGYGGVRITTSGGAVVYQLVLAASNSPLDFLSLPFNWTGDYTGDLFIQAGQQSGAAQTQPAHSDTNGPVRLEIVGIA